PTRSERSRRRAVASPPPRPRATSPTPSTARRVLECGTTTRRRRRNESRSCQAVDERRAELPANRASWPGSLRSDHEADCLRVLGPLRQLGRELAPARGGEPVELRLAAAIRMAPLGVEPALGFQTVECGIERAFLDL